MITARAICIAALLSTSGCAGVSTPMPMGEGTVELIPREWEGTWLSPDGDVLFVTDVDPKAGSILTSWVEEEDEKLALKQSVLYFGEAAGWTFVSMPDERASSVRYFWGRIERQQDETAVVWLPDDKKFEKLVAEGLLPGVVEAGNVHLSQLDSSQYLLIASEQNGVLFNWDRPIVYRRIKRLANSRFEWTWPSSSAERFP